MDLRRELTTITLQCQHNSLTYSKSYAYTHQVATTPHQRNLSWQQMETIAKNHTWAQCRDQWILGILKPSRYTFITAWLGEQGRRGGGWIVKSHNTKKSAVKQSLNVAFWTKGVLIELPSPSPSPPITLDSLWMIQSLCFFVSLPCAPLPTSILPHHFSLPFLGLYWSAQILSFPYSMQMEAMEKQRVASSAQEILGLWMPRGGELDWLIQRLISFSPEK